VFEGGDGDVGDGRVEQHGACHLGVDGERARQAGTRRRRDLAQHRRHQRLERDQAALQEVELEPTGDKLEAAGSFKVGPGTKAVAVVTVAGKASKARFTIK
jgi:hypothetical protein